MKFFLPSTIFDNNLSKVSVNVILLLNKEHHQTLSLKSFVFIQLYFVFQVSKDAVIERSSL